MSEEREYWVFMEEMRTTTMRKRYRASSLEEAKAMAERDPSWGSESGWEDYGGTDTSYEVRDDLTDEFEGV